MTEQLTRRQLRAARQAGAAAPEAPATPTVAGDDASAVTSVPVETESTREFQLSAPFGNQPEREGQSDPNLASATSGTATLTPDELLRQFRERIRSNYQEGSIPVPKAKLPASVTNPERENYAFDIDSIRERLRAAAEAARVQNQVAAQDEPLQPTVQVESEPIREISEYDIAARQSASSLQVEALRESFSNLQAEPALEAQVETDPSSEESASQQEADQISRRALRRQATTETIAAPFSPEAQLDPGYELAEAQVIDSEPINGEVPAVAIAERPQKPVEFKEEFAAESVDFQGKNLLAEPSTQSIVLDVIPDAVTMPINLSTDGLATGSISIIPEQSVSDVTGAIAGIKADESTLKDTVTGAVSVIEPVSALAVIAERRHHAVLPMTSLRRGWWQPYAVAVGIFAMIGAAAYAVFLILEVLNS